MPEYPTESLVDEIRRIMRRESALKSTSIKAIKYTMGTILVTSGMSEVAIGEFMNLLELLIETKMDIKQEAE